MNLASAPSRRLLAALFVVSGSMHFLLADSYARTVPPTLPWPTALVLISGGAEVLGGLGLLSERTRAIAGIGLILLLFMVWPANVQMLLQARAIGASTVWQLLLWLRLPVQLLMMVWVWRAARLGT
ncbi:MAG: DoxX family membrane protein [Gemmatimonadetes bacterium]|nr:DoxX family membrane protein [Gemmatimonadota bacterium]